MTEVTLSRWACMFVVLLSGCFQTEPIELGSDAVETHETSAVETDVMPEVEVEAAAETDTSPGAPCVSVWPATLPFGAISIGQSAQMTVTVTACGPETVRVSEVKLRADSSDRFSIVSQTSGVIRATETMEIVAGYTAGDPTVNPEGGTVADRAVPEIVSESQTPRSEVLLEGYPTACPVARIHSDQGPVVPVGVAMQLDGSGSTASLTEIVDYRWTVTAPSGSTSTLTPNDTVDKPTFVLDAEGTCTFALEVTDALGDTSCVAGTLEVTAVRDMRIYVQLTWDTPGDLNQGDVNSPAQIFSLGSDMDLHFLSPKANNVYFGSYDCYFANPNPEWGIFDPDDNPAMNRDDNDGAGPETIGVRRPENDVRYQVGVHYYDDWGFGDSLATIRIYIDGELRDTWSTPMMMDDMWDTHYIDWPSGVVTRIGETPHITPSYYY